LESPPRRGGYFADKQKRPDFPFESTRIAHHFPSFLLSSDIQPQTRKTMSWISQVNWHDIFIITVPIVIEKMIRPVIVYIFLIVGLRLAGKRELAQLNPFDLIVLLTLSNTVQNAIIGNDNTVTGGIIGASTLLVVNYLVVKFVHRHRRLEKFFEGRRDLLMKHGRILTDHLNREMMTRAELTAAAHRQGISSLAEVETAVMESTGVITFIVKTPTTDEIRHHEVLDVLDHLRQELNQLKAAGK
jgi:uncharacterized membrane protein YcaP (DUF421 family)